MDPLPLLRELGLNQLESEIYLFLLPQPALTAYKIARHLGKAPANVYTAVEVLARKGAVLIEDGAARTCRAVPPKEFLRRAERDFQEIARRARTHLANIEPVPLEERVYRVETVEQVFIRCQEMVESAGSVLVVDAFPLPLRRIAPALAEAAGRGVSVYVQTYEPIQIPGAQIALVNCGPMPVAQWRAQQLNVVSDGRENLMALLSLDGASVYQAYWSNSLYLSCMHHAGRLCEQTILRALAAHEEGGDVAAVLKSHPFFLQGNVPGQKELVDRYAAIL